MAVNWTSTGKLQIFSQPFSSQVTGHRQQPLIHSLLIYFSLPPYLSLPCVVLNVVFHSCHHGTQTILIKITRVIIGCMMYTFGIVLTYIRLHLLFAHTFSSVQSLTFVRYVVNILGFSLPFPVCISVNIDTHWVVLLSFVPPILVSITIFLYSRL